MADKSVNKSNNQSKHVPKDAQVIVSIMKDMGITDYEPKVINQLLEFTYRYVTCILDDSKIYANHSKKKIIDLEDVRLAVKLQMEKSFTNPPPRDVLLEVARTKNSIPLPIVKPSNGLRLPPDRYCLNGTNYKLKMIPKKTGKGPNLNIGGSLKLKPDIPKPMSIVKRPGTMSSVSRTQTIAMPKPMFKLSANTTNSNVSLMKPTVPTQIKTNIHMNNEQEQNQNSIVKLESEETSKRKREDDDYDVP